MADKKKGIIAKLGTGLVTFYTMGLYPFFKPSDVAKKHHYGKMQKNLGKVLEGKLGGMVTPADKDSTEIKDLRKDIDKTMKDLVQASGNPEIKQWQRQKIINDFFRKYKDKDASIKGMAQRVYGVMNAANSKFSVRNMNIKRAGVFFGGAAGATIFGVAFAAASPILAGAAMIFGLVATYKVYRGGISKFPIFGKLFSKIANRRKAKAAAGKEKKDGEPQLTEREQAKKDAKEFKDLIKPAKEVKPEVRQTLKNVKQEPAPKAAYIRKPPTPPTPPIG